MKILLKEIMTTKELSEWDVSFLTKVSRATVHRIAASEVDPRLGTLEKLAKGLGVGIDDLYESPYKYRKQNKCKNLPLLIRSAKPHRSTNFAKANIVKCG